MDAEEISYRFLRKIQQTEKTSPKLSDVRSNLYSEIQDYIKNLEEREEKEKTNQKKKILSEEIENTRRIFLDIYEKREKKILMAAITRARGGKPNLDNMLDIEKKLYNSIFEIISSSRKIALENKKDLVKPTEEKKEKVKVEDKSEENNKKDLNKSQKNNPIIRLKEDIPEFVGTDKKKYTLKKDDIISLSEQMSNMLCCKDASEKIEVGK